MLVELFAAQSEGTGIWQRQAFKLPQLGALLVAGNNEKLIDESSGAELLASGAEYKACLYAAFAPRTCSMHAHTAHAQHARSMCPAHGCMCAAQDNMRACT